MIYKLNSKKLGKKIREFSSTTYGKIMFVLCYIVFFCFFLIDVSVLTLAFLDWHFKIVLFYFNMATLISFVIGSYIYYRELKEYIEKTSK
ncbi:MAG: hypothetical protein IJ574_02915 [Bacilli bacterium]|nr:hypothetical protein [Bacilli bacterium]